MNFLVISNRYNFGPTSIVFHSPNLQIGHTQGYQQEIKKKWLHGSYTYWLQQAKEGGLFKIRAGPITASAFTANEVDEPEKDTAI